MTDSYQWGAWTPMPTEHVLIYEQARPSADVTEDAGWVIDGWRDDGWQA